MENHRVDIEETTSSGIYLARLLDETGNPLSEVYFNETQEGPVIGFIEALVPGRGYGQTLIDRLLEIYPFIDTGNQTHTLSSDMLRLIEKMEKSPNYHIERIGESWEGVNGFGRRTLDGPVVSQHARIRKNRAITPELVRAD